MVQPTRQVDHSALKVNQLFIISLLLLAFVLENVPLVIFVGAVLLLGTAVPRLSLFKRIYQHLLRPANLIKPNIIADNPEPHRFSQGVGATFVIASATALLLEWAIVGWVLAGLVVVLATVNLLFGFCAGCFVYYQCNRLGIPGFTHRSLLG